MLKRICITGLLFVGLVNMAFAASRPNTENVTLTLAGTEYSYRIPNNVKSITVQSRTAADFKIAFRSGESSTNYFTVKSGTAWYEIDIDYVNGTLYMQSANAGQVIEILVSEDY